jgi:hypothetical protein
MSSQNSTRPAGRRRRMSERKPHLVFREAPHMDSLVFTSLDRAIEIDRLHRAIQTSETWGEFRKRVGPEEYAALYDFYIPEPDDDPEDIDESELEPADDAPFSSDSVPGYCDGDYPPWLAQEIHKHLPKEILRRFAKYESSVLNGPFYFIDTKHRDALVKELIDAGFTVEERKDLEFW